MTHEQTIRAHCAEHGIHIRQSPSGTLRFIGYEVDVSFSDWKHTSIESLTARQPRPKRRARLEAHDLPNVAESAVWAKN